MNNRLIGVDVDLCICPSDVGWMNWLFESGHCVWGGNALKTKPYNLGKLCPTHPDPYQYWRELDYSQFTPIEGSVETLEKLSNYFGIVFISSVKGNHNKQKYYWLEKHFPFMQGYIATKEKYLMNDSVVAMIDDRNEMLKGFDFHKRVRFNTCYTQDVECSVVHEFSKWDDSIVKEICGRYL